MGALWTTEDREMLALLWPRASKNDIQRAFPDRTYSAIRRVAELAGLRCEVERNRLGTLTPLLGENPQAYYWVGFILADGHVTKQNQLVVCTARQDKEHLEKLASVVNAQIYEMPGRELYRVAIADKRLVPLLCQKSDINSNKTICPPVLPELNPVNFLALIAGFIDGDGDISRQHRRYDVRLRIMCHASWLNNLRIFEQAIYQSIGCTQKTSARLNSRGYALLGIYNRHILYDLKTKLFALGLPLLDRKWEKILSPAELARLGGR